MGNRKQRPDLNKTPPSDMKSCSSRMDSLLKEKSSHSVDRHALKSLSSIMDIMDGSTKRSNTHHSHQNLSPSIFLRRPRRYYGRQYSRRKPSNNAGASSSHVKSGACDEKLSFKSATQCDFDSGHQTENKEKAFVRQERTRTSSFVADAASHETVKMVCGLCERMLKRKPYIFENTISSGDLSVVAVLVCGHVYHADCLEQRTRHEDIQDPPCPLCAGLITQLGA